MVIGHPGQIGLPVLALVEAVHNTEAVVVTVPSRSTTVNLVVGMTGKPDSVMIKNAQVGESTSAVYYRGDGEKDRKKKTNSKTRHPEFHAKILRFFEFPIVAAI